MGNKRGYRSSPSVSRQVSAETGCLTHFSSPHDPTRTIGLIVMPFSPWRDLNLYGSE